MLHLHSSAHIKMLMPWLRHQVDAPPAAMHHHSPKEVLRFASKKTSQTYICCSNLQLQNHHRPMYIAQICKCNKSNKRETKSCKRNEQEESRRREGGGGWNRRGRHATLPEEGRCVLKQDEQGESRHCRCSDKRDERARKSGNPSKFTLLYPCGGCTGRCNRAASAQPRTASVQPGSGARADLGV
jgi:hypothetical protein